MKCSYTEVFAIASVKKNLGRVDTSYAYWKGNNKVARTRWKKNNTGEEKLIYAPEQQKDKIATEQRKNMLA